MTPQEFWDITFITVYGIRQHPRNNESIATSAKIAYEAAQLAAEIREQKCLSSSAEPSSGERY
jgi:hypothetical protein